MSTEKKLEFLETVHIPLWLLKDICWLMEYRALGVVVAIPTILVAFYSAWISRKSRVDFLLNLSVVFWILANANWMFDEFFELGLKYFSLVPFLLGVASFLYYVFLRLKSYRAG